MESLLAVLQAHLLTPDVGKHVCYLVAASWVFRNENTKMRAALVAATAEFTLVSKGHNERLERIETKIFPKEG